jgi:hypothetical protein
MPMASLFHASLSEFEPGFVVTASNQVNVYPTAAKLIDSARACKNVSRIVAVFATAQPGDAVAYLQTQLGVSGRFSELSDIHLYEVEMPLCGFGPMRLLKDIDNMLQANTDPSPLVREYLNPTRNWLFLEYYGPEFKVLKELDLPSNDAIDSCGQNYHIDSIHGERLSGL